MAFENLGIGGILKFSEKQAVVAMNRASMAMGNLKQRANRLGVGMRKVGQGVRSIGMASVASAAAFGFGAKAAIDFEHQMGAVAAVTRSSSEELKKNTEFARELGIKTAFSAKQAADAMEILGKFGLQEKSLRTATKGVTDLAAAEGINLAAASRVAVGSLRAMNMSVEESARSANVLALTSASTAASAIGLGESFSYAGGTLQGLGLDYEKSAAVFGLLANRMITGSRAGTGVMALFRGLQGSSKQATDLMKKLGINVKQFGGDLSRLPEIIEHVKEKLDKGYTNAIDKAHATNKIFGRFGQVVFSALAGSGGKALTKLTNDLKKAGTAFKDKFGKPMGAAAWMAQQRLNTVKGAITLFKSSLESFFISIFQGFLGPMKNRLKDITEGFNNILFAMQALEKDDSVKNQTKLTAKYGRTTVQVALGVRDAIKMVKDAWSFVGEQIKKVGKLFGKTIGRDSLRTVVKFALGIAMILATLAPLFIGLLGLKFVIGAIIPIISGMIIAIKAAALPVLLVLGAITAALLIMRNEGESLGQTAMRLLMGIYNFAKEIYTTALLPLFRGIWKIIKAFTIEIKGFWISVAAQLKGIILGLVSVFKSVVRIAIKVLTPIFKLIAGIIIRLRPVFMALVKFMLTVWATVVKIAKALVGLFKMVAGWIVQIINFLKPIILEIVSFFARIASWVVSVLGGAFRILGQIAVFVINVFRKILVIVKPVLAALIDMIKFIWAIGKAIGSALIWPLKVAFGWIKKIASWVWDKIKPGWDAVAGAVTAMVNAIVSVGTTLKNMVMVPLRWIARGLSKILYKLVGLAEKIPGYTASTLRSMASALASFGAGSPASRQKARTFTTGGSRRGFGFGFGVGSLSNEQFIALMERGKKARAAREAMKKGKKSALVIPPIKTNVNLKSNMSVDGRCVAAAASAHSVEIEERAGYGTTPWQRRSVVTRSTSTAPAKAR